MLTSCYDSSTSNASELRFFDRGAGKISSFFHERYNGRKQYIYYLPTQGVEAMSSGLSRANLPSEVINIGYKVPVDRLQLVQL